MPLGCLSAPGKQRLSFRLQVKGHPGLPALGETDGPARTFGFLALEMCFDETLDCDPGETLGAFFHRLKPVATLALGIDDALLRLHRCQSRVMRSAAGRDGPRELPIPSGQIEGLLQRADA